MRAPFAKVVASGADRPCTLVEEGVVKGAEGHAVGGVNISVPLVEPREQLEQTGEEGGEATGFKSIALLGFDDPLSERLRALGVVPTSPAVEGGAVRGRVGVTGKAFLGTSSLPR